MEEVGRSGVEEVGKVFQESEVYAGSECSLFSDDDEAYDANGGAMDDGQKSQVVECGQEKDKNISPSKKKRKVDQEDDEIQKDDVKEGRIKIQKRDESNSEVIDHEKNKKNIKRRKSEQVVTNGDEEESQEDLNRRLACGGGCGIVGLPSSRCNSCMHLFHEECMGGSVDGKLNTCLCSACEQYARDNKTSLIPVASISGRITRDGDDNGNDNGSGTEGQVIVENSIGKKIVADKNNMIINKNGDNANKNDDNVNKNAKNKNAKNKNDESKNKNLNKSNIDNNENNVEKYINIDNLMNEDSNNKDDPNKEYEDEHEFQMLVIDPIIKSHIDLCKSFMLKVEDKSILIDPSQIRCARKKVILQLPKNTLHHTYINYHKVLLKFIVGECDGVKNLSVILR